MLRVWGREGGEGKERNERGRIEEKVEGEGRRKGIYRPCCCSYKWQRKFF